MGRLKNWFTGLSTAGKVTTVAVASVLSLGTINAMAQQGVPAPSVASTVTAPAPKADTPDKPEPKVEIKTVKVTQPIGYGRTVVKDPNLAQGVKEVRSAGAKGVRTLTYRVTFTDGTETGRKLVSNTVTTSPVKQVIAEGTKILQPDCPNGTYINTVGNTVCRPYESSGAPAGATAQCEDGTYSFSQSRRGTCSRHGGVASWL